MAVYKRTYKAYQGRLTPGWSRFTVLSRYGFSRLFESRPFTAFTVLCFGPFLVGLSYIYLIHSAAVQALLGVQLRQTQLINNYSAFVFLGWTGFMGFVLTAWGAPGMISKDFANHSIQLYLSRPLSRAQYLLGKVMVMAVLLSFISWIPGLILFVLQAELQGHGWGWDNLWLAGSMVVAALLGIALVSLLAMALAVWVRWRIAATALMIGTFFLLPGFGQIFDAVLRTHWGRLINFPYVVMVVWANLFRIPPAELHHSHLDLVPLWSAWAALLSVCGICICLLHRRLKAREVERS
jgi:ABC-2 type transport system permease protein